MGGNATDYGKFMGVLLNDIPLKNLLLIPLADQTNYSKLMTDYFVETFTSDTITTVGVCRLVIHSAPSSNTSNMMVRENNLVIEVFVPTLKDRLAGFERRSNQIADRLIEIFHMKSINDRKFRLENNHELSSPLIGFKRMYLQFSYFRVYS